MTRFASPDQPLPGGLRLSRRQALLGLTSAFTLGRASLALAAPLTDQRFVVIILRGALDGMSAVQPYGDPHFAALRGKLALPPGQPGGVLDLGGMYGLHPALATYHDMYKQGDALILHAIAGHYRSRSHFEAQDFLESGADQRLSSGWLNRAVAALPGQVGSGTHGRDLALSVGLSAPLLLRGPARVQAYAPDHFARPSADLYHRLLSLTAPDPIIGPALAEGIKERGFDASVINQATDPMAMGPETARNGFAILAGAAGRLLAQPGGPRIAALEIDGWDTHAGQIGRLNAALLQLDSGLAALRAGLGASWRQTVILAVTEFGRTARINGTGGTDHGTASVALLAGGAVRGGRVQADWPGLSDAQLFQNRDLAPSTDLRAALKGVLADHLGIAPERFASILPGSGGVAPLSGLVRG